MTKRTTRTKRSQSTAITGLSAIILALIILVAYELGIIPPFEGVLPTEPPAAPPVVEAPVDIDTPWLLILFTNPELTTGQEGGIDRYVVEAINAARESVDVASFDLNLPSVVDALIAAQGRGVRVRLVLDLSSGSTNLSGSRSAGIQAFDALARLRAARINMVDGGRSNGLMHNKIIIIDGALLFTGSWNLSYNDTFRNDNNLLKITAPALIANYQAKFDEFFIDRRFGRSAQIGARTPRLVLDGTPVENYFSPPDNVMEKIIAEVKRARQSIRFMAFTYTHPELAAAMIERAEAGVQVQGVIENRGASQGALPGLFCANIDVKRDGNKYTMHHKVILIDDTTVITGSFNFTKSADERNDENVLIIRNSSVAAAYAQEFQSVFGQGQTPDGDAIQCPVN